MDDPMFGTSKDIVLIGLYLLTYWGNKNALINVIRLLQNIQKNETFLLYVMHPLKKFYESLTNKNDKRNFGSIINVGVRQTFIRLPYPSFHKKDGHNHTHPIQSKRRNPIERMMNYVQLQLYRKNV